MTGTETPQTPQTEQAQAQQTTAPAAPPIVLPDAQPVDEITAAAARMRSGANWFYWIAALSLINSAIMLFNGNMHFVCGLGITTVIDALASQAGGVTGKVIALGFDAIFLGLFVLFGVLSNRRSMGAFVTGIVIYGLDTLIYLGVQDWFSVAFHAYALYGLINGARACGQLKKLEKAVALMPHFDPASVQPPIGHQSSMAFTAPAESASAPVADPAADTAPAEQPGEKV